MNTRPLVRLTLPVLTSLLLGALWMPTAQAIDVQRDDVAQFIRELATEHELDPAWVSGVLADAAVQQSILDAISRPAERVLTWGEYRDIFIQPERIAAGVAFYREHAPTLARIEAETGVSRGMILGIIGVESYYGRITGKHRVVDALATLGFDYPPRAKFFRNELAEAFVLAAEEQLDIGTLMGSYAGAMGPPQFIPSSYRAYAVDGDGDGQRDLIGSWPDIMASVANYFAVHKWQSGQPVAARGELSAKATAVPLQDQLQLQSTVGQLSRSGLLFATDLGTDAAAGAWQLEGKAGTEYWVGFDNLYVITRYNRSVMYALAAWQLGEAVLQEAAL
ncbi:MAG: lytic murein transglycosylase B [Gammaproteobacteria bacterium]|jgi:membrane-bound lytic murein transglycosylase B|nr:lytic murein transglycosylase B [Gammaproteobacteria bacterium]